MKQLSIEEKAKAYDEAIKVAQRFYNNSVAITKKGLEDIFPELAESEDERIRKEIIATIHLYYGEPLEDEAKEMIAWLEKQGQTFTQKDVDDAYLKGVCDTKQELEKQGEQNTAWSEEEEVKINRIVACLENLNVADNDILLKDVDWLKSLKDKVLPKQEWSEEDEKMLNQIIKDYERGNESWLKGQGSLPFGNRITWLKSLRPQNTWKPSNEQMLAIDTAINVIGKGTLSGKQLIELQEQLKKLREE